MKKNITIIRLLTLIDLSVFLGAFFGLDNPAFAFAATILSAFMMSVLIGAEIIFRTRGGGR